MSTRQYDNFNDLVTFTRSSGGTALRPISYGSELVTNGTFDTDTSGWTENTSGVVTWSDGVALVGNGNGVLNTYFSQTVSAVSGKTYEIKVGVNLLSGAGVRILLDGVNQGGGAYFTSDQTFYYTATSSTIDVEVYRFRNHTGSVEIDNVSVKEVLFDQAGAPLTLFNHLTDTPRIEYNAAGERLGLLVEEARTNLVLQSNEFTAATGEVTKDSTGIDGQVSAWTLENPASNAARVDLSVTVATSTTYTASVFAKQGTTEFLYLSAIFFTTPANGSVWFDLSLGVVGIENTGLSGLIEPVGNGWYRCSITFTTDAADTSGQIRVSVSKGNGQTTSDAGDNVLIYGAQLEAGAFPTSYIPTSGATATRATDVCSMPVSAFGYNKSEGTALLEFSLSESFVSSGFPSVIMFYSDGLNRFGLTTALNSDDFRFNGLDSGVSQFDLSKTTNSTGETQKHIFGFEDNLFSYVVDGDTPSVDSSGTLPDVAEIVIGASGPSSGYMNCHIKSIKYYPRRLTNAQLQELTT